MADTLQVVITGKDGVSKVFKEVAQSADATGKAVSKAGSEGEKGFRRIGDGAKSAKVELSDLSAAATVLGAGLAYAGNAALNQQQVIIGLQRAYGDAADEMINFADEIASVSIFNDDDILKGERYFATLRNNYDLSIEQIQELMRVTADLASASGTTFEDASSRVTAAIRGEGEAAEYLGLTMNQQAIDRENLTLTMSNQEAAQFRLNALYQQTGVYEGTAIALAESEVGTRAKLTNAIQDNAQALGGFIGPLGTMIGGAGMAVAGLGGMTGSFVKLGGAMKGVLPMLSAIATNPIFLGGAAIAGGLVLWDKIADKMGEGERQQQAMLESTQNLTQSLNDMRVVMGDMAAADRFEASLNSAQSSMTDFVEHWQEGVDLVNDPEGPKGWLWDQAIAQAAKNNSDNIVAEAMNIAEAMQLTDGEITSINTALNGLSPLFTTATIDQQKLKTAIDELFVAFSETGDADALASGLEGLSTNSQALLKDAESLTLSLAELNEELDYLRLRGDDSGLAGFVTQLNNLSVAADDVRGALTTGELKAYNEAWEGLNEAIRSGEYDSAAIIASLGRLDELYASGQIGAGDYAAQVVALEQSLEKAAEAAGSYATGLKLAEEAAERFADQQERVAAIVALTDSQMEAGKGRIQERIDLTIAAAEAFEEFHARRAELLADLAAVAGVDDPLSSWNLSGNASAFAALADNITDAGAALDTTFRAVVGNTNAIGSQVDGVEKWALELINVRGEYGKIDDLLASGLITLEQYNAAQAAQEEISAANLAVQNDILKIQTMQAPLIAEQTEATQAYMAELAGLPAQQQLIALGWMDATTAGRAMEFQQLAIAAAAGQIPRDAFESYIIGAAKADPVLRALLEELELIAVDREGNITINADGAKGAISDMDQLKLSVNALIEVLGGTVPALSLDVQGMDDVEHAKEIVDGLPSEKNIAVNLTEGPTGLSGSIRNILNHITGQGDGTGGAAYDLPVTPTLDPGGLEALRASFATPVDVPITPVLQSGAGFVSGAIGSALDSLGGGEEIVFAARLDSTRAEREAAALADTIEATDVRIGVTVDGASLAIGLLSAVTNTADAVPDSTSTDVRVINAVSSSDFLNNVTAAANAIPVSTQTDVVVNGAALAIGLLQSVANVANSIPDTVSTTVTTNLVTNQITNVATRMVARHGGIPGMAHGGIPVELAEAGPELLHFAGGGVMPIYDRGIYNIPQNTYVESANSARSRMGEINLGGIHIHGNVYGIDDLLEKVSEGLTPIIADVFDERHRGMGVSS